jgi:hypothetical protein
MVQQGITSLEYFRINKLIIIYKNEKFQFQIKNVLFKNTYFYVDLFAVKGWGILLYVHRNTGDS